MNQVHRKKRYLFFDFFNYIRPDFFLLHSPLTKGIFWNKYSLETEANFPIPPFSHPHSTLLYKAYKLWQNGDLVPSKITCSNTELISPNLKDNYLFITYEFGIKQAVLILIRRLLTLKNPVKNLEAFVHAVHLFTSKKLPPRPAKQPTNTNEIQKQDVSVIIITRNRYNSLHKLLHQLENQTILPIETLVIDHSEQLIQLPYSSTINSKQLPAVDAGFVTGRNLGILKAKGSLLLFIDDDCEILPDFIEQHIQSVQKGFHVSTGQVIETKNRKLADQQQNKKVIAWFLPGGNFMISKQMISKIGLFNPHFNKLPFEDLEYYLRLLESGVSVICNYLAPVYHKKLLYGGSRNNLFAQKYLAEVISLSNRKVLKLYAGLIPSDTILILINNRFLITLSRLLSKIYYPNCFIETIFTILVWPYIYIYSLIRLEKDNPKYALQKTKND